MFASEEESEGEDNVDLAGSHIIDPLSQEGPVHPRAENPPSYVDLAMSSARALVCHPRFPSRNITADSVCPSSVTSLNECTTLSGNKRSRHQYPEIECDDGLATAVCTDNLECLGYTERLFGFSPSRFTDLAVGMVFPNKNVLRDVVDEIHIRCLRECVRPVSNHERVLIQCKTRTVSGCRWELRASEVGGMFRINKYMNQHTCGVQKRHNGLGHNSATSKFIAKELKRFVLEKADLSSKQTRLFISSKYNIWVSKWKAQRARRLAVVAVYGTQRESFSVLPRLGSEMAKRKQGCVYHLYEHSQTRIFMGFFWAFGPAIQAFRENLRPVIIVDGTHLRSVYKGVLLVACCQDADNRIIQLAYCIVENENTGNCALFFKLLRQYVLEGYSRLGELLIITDKGTGLKAGMKQELPTVNHVWCVRHFMENFHLKFPDDSLRPSLWIAATTALQSTFDYHMGLIKKANPQAYAWLMKKELHKWTQLYCPLSRWGIFTTNPCESTNAALRAARALPVAGLVQETREMAAQHFAQRYELSKTRQRCITRAAAKKVAKVRDRSHQCVPVAYGHELYEVQHLGALFSVDLNLKTCSCRQYQTAGLPCIHACSAITLMGRCTDDYVYEFYSMENFIRTYKVTFKPLEAYREWPLDPTSPWVIPPAWKRAAGRPKGEKRIESQSSLFYRKTVQCGNCKGRGHNRLGCSEPPPLRVARSP